MRTRKQDRLHDNQKYPIGLGCLSCEDRSICGGLGLKNFFSCLDLCCGTPKYCDFVCPRDLSEFIDQTDEVESFDFDTIGRVTPLKVPRLPLYVPIIFHKSANRLQNVSSDVVAISLMQLIDLRTGECLFSNKEELYKKFGLKKGTRIIITGVADDLPLQKYWHTRGQSFLLALSSLELEIVTSPNFSTFVNAPRWTDLTYLKRSVICWKEFMDVDIPCSLHLNGRTESDWQRAAEFIAEREEVVSIAFEFATVNETRKELYVDRLLKISSDVPRRLQLIIRGGIRYLTQLSKHFDLVFLDSDPFMMASQRSISDVDPKIRFELSDNLETIDALLEYHIKERSVLIQGLANPMTLEP